MTTDLGHNDAVKALLGIGPTEKLPVDGTLPKLINGDTWIWVQPLPHGPRQRWEHRRSTHRLLACCPECHKVLSAGRLKQHVKVHR
jgi:hypothetical protein